MFPFLTRAPRAEEPSPAKQRSAGLSTQELRLRATIDSAPVGIGVSTVDGQWLWFNRTACTILGYSRNELTRVTLRDITHAEDAKRETRLLRELLQGDIATYRIRKRVMDKLGKYRTITVSISLSQVNTGEPWMLVHSIEPGAIEGDTAHDADRLSTLILNRLMETAVIRTDGGGVITGWNAGAARIFGYTDEEVAGQNRSTLYRGEDVWSDKPSEQLIDAATNGQCERDDWRVRRDGTPLWVTSVVTAYAPDGVTRGFVEVITAAIDRQTIDPSSELNLLREDLKQERHKNARLIERVRHLKTADNLHVRELRIVTGALRKERSRRKHLEEQLHATPAAPSAPLVPVTIVTPPVPVPPITVEPEWRALRDSTLLDVIFDLEQDSRTGLLAVSNGQQQRGFYFLEGNISSSASSDESSTLGERLVQLGIIQQSERQRAREVSRSTRLPFGRVLLVLGILDEEHIAAAMRDKIEEDVRVALGWREAAWTFSQDAQPSGKLVPVSVGSAHLHTLAAELPPAPPPASVTVIASMNATRYHLETCPSAKRITARARLNLPSASDAAARGLEPCRNCLPALEAIGEPSPRRAVRVATSTAGRTTPLLP